MKEKDNFQKLKEYLSNVRLIKFYTKISGNQYLIILKERALNFKLIEILSKGPIESIKELPEFIAIFNLYDKSVEAFILNSLAKPKYSSEIVRVFQYTKIPVDKKLKILWGKYSDERSNYEKITLLFAILYLDSENRKALNEIINLRDNADLHVATKSRINRLIHSRQISEKVEDVEKSVKSIMDSAEGSSEDLVTKEIVPKLSVLEKQVTEIKDSLSGYKDIPQQFEALESYTKESFKDLKAWRESQNVYLSDDRKEDIKDLITLTNSRIDDINTTMDRDKRTMQIWLGILSVLITVLIAIVAIVIPILLNNLADKIEASMTIIGILAQIFFN